MGEFIDHQQTIEYLGPVKRWRGKLFATDQGKYHIMLGEDSLTVTVPYENRPLNLETRAVVDKICEQVSLMMQDKIYQEYEEDQPDDDDKEDWWEPSIVLICPDCGGEMVQIPEGALPGQTQEEIPTDWVYCPECDDQGEEAYGRELEACFEALDFVNHYFSKVFVDAIMFINGEIHMERENMACEPADSITGHVKKEYWMIDPMGGES